MRVIGILLSTLRWFGHSKNRLDNDGESLSARLPNPCSLGDMVVYYECMPF
jgi:hypothetical protein